MLPRHYKINSADNLTQTAQWSLFVSSNPEALLARLNIIVHQALAKGFSRQILEMMKPTCARHLDVFNHISFPAGNAYTLVQLEVTPDSDDATEDELDDPDPMAGRHDAMLKIEHEEGELKMYVQMFRRDAADD